MTGTNNTPSTNWTRRQFIQTSSAAASLVALGGLTTFVKPARADDRTERIGPARKILFLGGTGFLGPHTIDRLLAHGHEVTLFNRGRRSEDLFPQLEQITGNRIVDEGPGLAPLEEAIEAGRTWDVVIDTASVHTWVENSAKILKDAAKHYIFISSMSAYSDNTVVGQTEDGQLHTMPDDIADSIDRLPYDMNYYGAVKVRSEQAAERHFPGTTTVLRPGLIVGPRDFTHRFTYWPHRVRAGGRVLAPGTPDDKIMFIDVRDLADFLVRVIETQTMGYFNTNGPVDRRLSIGQLLDACKATTASDAQFVWGDAAFLAANGVGPWQQMPVWIPPQAPGMEGFHAKSVEKAAAAGLKSRPLSQTISDTLAWHDEWREEMKPQGYIYEPGLRGTPGITPLREKELIAMLDERANNQDEGQN